MPGRARAGPTRPYRRGETAERRRAVNAVDAPTTRATRTQPRSWVDNAVRLIEADSRRSADPPLLRYPLPAAWCDGVDVQLYLKDETTHITGSLKHRLARSLFLFARCHGGIGGGTPALRARA